MDQQKIMNDTEIRMKGIEALQKSLGAAATLRFLTLRHREATNYVEVSHKIYEEQTIDEIFERAKQNWQD